jgi:antitoxin (DNA-binding transcriptional repressor) of toxin-antitoxin stability system
MTTMSVENVQARLPELIERLAPGEEVIITCNEKPVAQIVPFVEKEPQPQFGGCQGMLTILVEDDEHLADFQEYMP